MPLGLPREQRTRTRRLAIADMSSRPAHDPDDTPAEDLAKYVEWMDDMMFTEYGLEP